jgi:hypothetical protein
LNRGDDVRSEGACGGYVFADQNIGAERDAGDRCLIEPGVEVEEIIIEAADKQ